MWLGVKFKSFSEIKGHQKFLNMFDKGKTLKALLNAANTS
jgi:hypothetical protein